MDVLTAYALKKGWLTAMAGRPDVNRAGNASTCVRSALLVSARLTARVRTLPAHDRARVPAGLPLPHLHLRLHLRAPSAAALVQSSARSRRGGYDEHAVRAQQLDEWGHEGAGIWIPQNGGGEDLSEPDLDAGVDDTYNGGDGGGSGEQEDSDWEDANASLVIDEDEVVGDQTDIGTVASRFDALMVIEETGSSDEEEED
ncbi:uncharacterized protein FIBRA_05231 [Fibroporia radiculosa]|uniref:Uncharacterized protein n=1 Tax=Fibroporia radiculosa TaxID=599839 RepID=J4IAL3_9APHY|nr:uncharacterized protein FIBRA_05231 [Fibroporia radiculosa]CCM03111.1 predicted protein [Fibroporia radiculosa]